MGARGAGGARPGLPVPPSEAAAQLLILHLAGGEQTRQKYKPAASTKQKFKL